MSFSLSVPIKYHNAASIIASLSEEKIGAVVSFLQDAAYPFSLNDAQTQDYSALFAAEIPSPDEVIEFIASLYYLYQGLDSPHAEDDMLEGIQQFFLRDQPVKSLSTNAQTEQLANNLRRIINTKTSLELAAKVTLIKNDHSHAYVQSKIYTDVRPVFGRSDAELRGAVIIHTLKLSYQDGEQRKDFFVALDQSDLITLRLAIERAQAKESSMREFSLLNELQFFE
jgi:hypothetical protein